MKNKFILLMVVLSLIFCRTVSAQIQTQIQKIDLNTAAVINPVTTSQKIEIKCKIIEEATAKDLDNLLIEIRNAEKMKKNNLILEIKEKINIIHQRAEKAKAECPNQKTIIIEQETEKESFIMMPIQQKPISTNNVAEIKTYYREEMENIFQKNKEVELVIISLKDLRMEVDEMTAELIRSRKSIEISEIKDLIEKISIEPTRIKVNDFVVNIEEQKEIKIELKGKKIKIIMDRGKKEIEIEDGSFKVKSMEELVIKNERIEIAGKKIEVLPTEIVSLFKIKPGEVIDFSLNIENNKPAYNIKTLEKRRLFGFIPVSISRNAKIDATTLEKNILENNIPWWSFLTFK